jgi:hypothetical protein
MWTLHTEDERQARKYMRWWGPECRLFMYSITLLATFLVYLVLPKNSSGYTMTGAIFLIMLCGMTTVRHEWRKRRYRLYCKEKDRWNDDFGSRVSKKELTEAVKNISSHERLNEERQTAKALLDADD